MKVQKLSLLQSPNIKSSVNKKEILKSAAQSIQNNKGKIELALAAAGVISLAGLGVAAIVKGKNPIPLSVETFEKFGGRISEHNTKALNYFGNGYTGVIKNGRDIYNYKNGKLLISEIESWSGGKITGTYTYRYSYGKPVIAKFTKQNGELDWVWSFSHKGQNEIFYEMHYFNGYLTGSSKYINGELVNKKNYQHYNNGLFISNDGQLKKSFYTRRDGISKFTDEYGHTTVITKKADGKSLPYDADISVLKTESSLKDKYTEEYYEDETKYFKDGKLVIIEKAKNEFTSRCLLGCQKGNNIDVAVYDVADGKHTLITEKRVFKNGASDILKTGKYWEPDYGETIEIEHLNPKGETIGFSKVGDKQHVGYYKDRFGAEWKESYKIEKFDANHNFVSERRGYLTGFCPNYND